MSKVSNFWRYITGGSRYFWDDLRNAVEQPGQDEVASMEIALPLVTDRAQWITQLAEETAMDEKGYRAIYVTDQDNHWEGKRFSFPTKDEEWLYIAQMFPGYEITDVHITDISVHVYIKKRVEAYPL